jgi:phospholipase C
MTGPTLSYDSFTADMVHRLFHMWQQSDCGIHNATASNPSGCRNDLYPL